MSGTTHPKDVSPARRTVRRTLGLARSNALLMSRNRVTLLYAVVLPVLPMALLFTGERGDTALGAVYASTSLLMAMMFPVYFNILSLVVTGRDDLVLKRLRSGETRDAELLASLALPGVGVTALVAVVLVVLGLALGQPWLANPVLFVVAVLVCCAAFAAMAIWTAAWTRNAEAAQLTSMPVILLAVAGTLKPVFPDALNRFVELTPGAALDTLVRVTWFGGGPDGPVDFAATWSAAGSPLLVLVAWTLLGAWLARRGMRWEPRS